MPRLRRAELAAYAVCAVLVAVVGWRAMQGEEAPASRPLAARPAAGVAGADGAASAEGGAMDAGAAGARSSGGGGSNTGASNAGISNAGASGGGSGGGSPGAGASAAAGSVPQPVTGGAAGPSALVHVVGAVRHPGVYRLADGARIQDAIELAGGATAKADLAAVNLAAKVADAQQIVVPKRGQAPPPAAAGAPTGAAPAGPPVNLNTATAEELDTLEGVGPATAQKILAERTRRGGFRSVDDLADIPGIGPKRLAAIKDRVTV
ncbi:MAG: ComEA family DNA-binding protein [Solirubrobacterales bacterium]|nr:ComEA family DNA-binding protein [Solirubrobacterales bacterium]